MKEREVQRSGVHSRYDASKWLTGLFYGWGIVALAGWEWVGELLG